MIELVIRRSCAELRIYYSDLHPLKAIDRWIYLRVATIHNHKWMTDKMWLRYYRPYLRRANGWPKDRGLVIGYFTDKKTGRQHEIIFQNAKFEPMRFDGPTYKDGIKITVPTVDKDGLMKLRVTNQ